MVLTKLSRANITINYSNKYYTFVARCEGNITDLVKAFWNMYDASGSFYHIDNTDNFNLRAPKKIVSIPKSTIVDIIIEEIQ